MKHKDIIGKMYNSRISLEELEYIIDADLAQLLYTCRKNNKDMDFFYNALMDIQGESNFWERAEEHIINIIKHEKSKNETERNEHLAKYLSVYNGDAVPDEFNYISDCVTCKDVVFIINGAYIIGYNQGKDRELKYNVVVFNQEEDFDNFYDAYVYLWDNFIEPENH